MARLSDIRNSADGEVREVLREAPDGSLVTVRTWKAGSLRFRKWETAKAMVPGRREIKWETKR